MMLYESGRGNQEDFGSPAENNRRSSRTLSASPGLLVTSRGLFAAQSKGVYKRASKASSQKATPFTRAALFCVGREVGIATRCITQMGLAASPTLPGELDCTSATIQHSKEPGAPAVFLRARQVPRPISRESRARGFFSDLCSSCITGPAPARAIHGRAIFAGGGVPSLFPPRLTLAPRVAPGLHF